MFYSHSYFSNCFMLICHSEFGAYFWNTWHEAEMHPAWDVSQSQGTYI